MTRSRQGRPFARQSAATIARFYHLPIVAAANELGMGTSALKHQCRALGIVRWPFRKLNALTCIENRLKWQLVNKNLSDEMSSAIRAHLGVVTTNKDLVINNPNTRITSNGVIVSTSAARPTSARRKKKKKKKKKRTPTLVKKEEEAARRWQMAHIALAHFPSAPPSFPVEATASVAEFLELASYKAPLQERPLTALLDASDEAFDKFRREVGVSSLAAWHALYLRASTNAGLAW